MIQRSTAEAPALSASAFPRILAIDADAAMRATLESGLDSHGFEVRAISDPRHALGAITEWTPEAILLGNGAPGLDSFSTIASLRGITDVPILMLSGRRQTPDKVAALTRGADDYITTPFDLEELAAYIRARLRRPRMHARDVVNYADLTVDVTHRKAARAGKAMDLSTREFDLLLTLVRHPGQVFTRSQLLDLVWGADRDVTPATVETYISYLRAKVDSEKTTRLIHTQRGVGYTLRAE